MPPSPVSRARRVDIISKLIGYGVSYTYVYIRVQYTRRSQSIVAVHNENKMH